MHEQYRPGWTNGVVTLLDPAEKGWKTNVQIEREQKQEQFKQRLIDGSIMPLILDGRDYYERDSRESNLPVMRRVLQACKVVRP